MLNRLNGSDIRNLFSRLKLAQLFYL